MQDQKENIILKLLLFVSAVFLFSSCGIIQGIWELHKKKAKVYSYHVADKEIKFIAMHHLGKKQFYDDVKNKIALLKKDGYVVYYELITSDVKLDSLQKDTLKKKYRKLKGFGGTYQEVSRNTLLQKYMQQPNYPDLGTTDTDLRADINKLQFINEWEKQNGKIVLDSVDFHTPFDAKYDRKSPYTKKQWNNVAIKYRNRYLVNLIKANNDKKIVAVYGKGHRKDFKKRLKQ
ncbi:MAG: hypothetical protein ACYDCN_03530 [Bacteroidia bacterium]